MFQAVEIDGVPYWDGGYMGNPALFPFYNAVKTDDILLVQINPIIRRVDAEDGARHQQPDERDHLQRLASGATARGRFRHAPAQARQPEEKGTGVDGYRDLRLHRIDGAES